MLRLTSFFLFFFFNDPATTEIYTLSLHDALPISVDSLSRSHIARLNPNGNLDTSFDPGAGADGTVYAVALQSEDRKSTRLNSSHDQISYAVFCLKKKKTSDTIYGQHSRTTRAAGV